MNTRPQHFVWILALLGLCSSCSFTDTKVGDYPLPRHGGTSVSNTLVQDVQDPNTFGAGLGSDPSGNEQIPLLPVPPDPQPTVTPPLTPTPPSGGGTATAPTTGAKYPYALPIPGDPSHVRSPYDNTVVEITNAKTGRPYPSGTRIRAKGEKDPSRIFIIP